MDQQDTGGKRPRFEACQEYETLRSELLASKAYVFERPLLLAGVGAALLVGLEPEFLPPGVAGVVVLLIFNFWFTQNRLFSSARIVAYIQLEHEEAALGRWVGWETCLREYRRWIRTVEKDRAKRNELIDSRLDKEAAPRALMYYPPIYQLHVAFVVLGIIATATTAFNSRQPADLLAAFGVLALSVPFAINAVRRRPSRMRLLIERNRVIWENVFRVMLARGEK